MSFEETNNNGALALHRGVVSSVPPGDTAHAWKPRNLGSGGWHVGGGELQEICVLASPGRKLGGVVAAA